MQTRLENINLFTRSPERLRDFYHEVFGLPELEFRSIPPDLFVLDAKASRLCLKRGVTPAQQLGTSSLELCFEVEDLEQVQNQIKAHGGTILSDDTPDHHHATFYATDPDGNHLLVQYCFRAQAYYFS